MNLKPYLMQTEQQTQERRIVNPHRGRFDTDKFSGARTATWNSTAQATKMETASINSGAELTSLNEFRMLKYFKRKWKRFWIISLKIWANIAVTKHVLLADEFRPYRPRLLQLGFYSLHVNAMKWNYVRFSQSKLPSFFWKISLNSRLIRLEGFNNKISTDYLFCVPRGPVVRLWPGESQVPSSIPGITFFSLLLFFSFSFHFRYNSFVMFLYIAYNF